MADNVIFTKEGVYYNLVLDCDTQKQKMETKVTHNFFTSLAP